MRRSVAVVARSAPRVLRTPPTPLRVDAARVVLAGTVLWVAAGVLLLPFWAWLHRNHHMTWLWTCAAGAVLGVAGLVLMSRHRGEGRL